MPKKTKAPKPAKKLTGTLHMRLEAEDKAGLDALIERAGGIGNYSQHVRIALKEYLGKRKG